MWAREAKTAEIVLGIRLAGVETVKLPGVVIETFLRNHPESYCIDCFSRKLDIPGGQVSMAARRLQETGGFSFETGTCSQCRRQLSVIQAIPAA